EIGIKKTNEIILNSNLNLVFLEKNEMNKYIKLKDRVFVRSKADKKRVKKVEKNIMSISSVTGEGVKSLLKKVTKKLIKNQK
mgnify:CR=1